MYPVSKRTLFENSVLFFLKISKGENVLFVLPFTLSYPPFRIMKPDGRNIPVTVEAIYNEEGEAMESAPHAQQRIYVKLTEMPEVFDILRRGE